MHGIHICFLQDGMHFQEDLCRFQSVVSTVTLLSRA